MFCKLTDLRSESDVEQKFIYPMLTATFPQGCGYNATETFTKANLRFFDIGKGRSGRKYRPDYVLVLNGLPVCAIEAKHPDEDVYGGQQEARLYANEINSIYPSGVNPCCRVFSCNGNRLVSSPWDQETPDVDIDFQSVTPVSELYHKLIERLGKESLLRHADEIAKKIEVNKFWRAADLLGGITARDEDIGYNTFGKELAFEFEHIFNPTTPKQRTHIVRNAYVTSKRRRHYADEIERFVYRAIPRASKHGVAIEDTDSPTELLKVFGRGKELQNKIMLLVGAVGSGKSTFVDFFREVKISQTLKQQTIWIHIDVNETPPTQDRLEHWLADKIFQGLVSSDRTIDFDDPEVVKKVYSVELKKLEKRVLSSLPPRSVKRDELIASEIQRLDADIQASTKALSRFLCGERNRLLVIVMDNCDKELDSKEQLDVFQLVRWVQSWLPCLVFLPIRDVTYELYKKQPPLDTVIKDYVFRMESPPFTKVLRKRIDLTLTELNQRPSNQMLSYQLDNGVVVRYPASDLGMYLACLYKSIFEYDDLLRRMLMGLADRNIRRAIEIFIEFCKSGHISGKHILNIRLAKGDYALPLDVVMRVLLRLDRRFYDGDTAIIKNLFQANPDSSSPNNFPRYCILKWLEVMWNIEGPTGVRGFHRTETMVRDLVPLGMDTRQIWKDLSYLVEAGCVTTEHRNRAVLSENDLISLSASGRAHLRLIRNTSYLSACAEDSWIADERLTREVARRIGKRSPRSHFSQISQARIAEAMAKYLVEQNILEKAGTSILNNSQLSPSKDAKALHESTEKLLKKTLAKYGWLDANKKFAPGTIWRAKVQGIAKFGLFIKVVGGPLGMLHQSNLLMGKSLDDFHKNDEIKVKVLFVDEESESIQFALDE